MKYILTFLLVLLCAMIPSEDALAPDPVSEVVLPRSRILLTADAPPRPLPTKEDTLPKEEPKSEEAPAPAVTEEPVAVAVPREEKYPAVYVDAPTFRQTDSRWADVKLGSSYETVKSAGCTTCCVAMAESVRQGRTVTPDEIARNYAYSPDGLMEWKARYGAHTDEATYLAVAYRELCAGRPVLLASYKRNGAQHWVLIVGFTGGDTLDASRFLICDPGTKKRTTVADFRSVFTRFYKIMTVDFD